MFDNLIKNLENFKDHDVPAIELLNPMFISKHTEDKNFEEFINQSGLVNEEKPLSEEIFESEE